MAAQARRPRPTPCPAARYIVHDAPLLGSSAGPTPDRILLDATQLAVASGCAPVAVKPAASKRGTTLKATWTACTGATGAVHLKARIDPTCHTMTGTLLARKSRPRVKRKFTAGLEQCDVTGGDCGAATSTVRYCDFVPGMSVPVTMPPDVVNPPPPTTTTLPPLPSPTVVPPATTQAQAGIFTAIHDAVTQNYVYADFNGVDWTAIGTTYSMLIQQGLTDADFYAAMDRMISELGDHHSNYLTPEEVADQAAADAVGVNYVGIGAIILPVVGTGTASILLTYPGSPAREAGLRPHDLLLTADGKPVLNPPAPSPLRGDENTQVEVVFERPGQAQQTITLTRHRVTGFTPIDACVVPTTRIGYILVTTFLDPMIDDEIGAALAQMTAPGPLDGLVFDNRENSGGSSAVALPTLGFFTSGVQGQEVSRTSMVDLGTTANDIGGSQTVPLTILADHGTVSFGEIFTGFLQNSGRAQVVGGRTAGNVELLVGHNFSDTSRLWIATYTVAPNGLSPGVWEGVGITPDVSVPTRWDLFTEATDPALAQAIGLLQSGAASVRTPRCPGCVPAAIGRERPLPLLPEVRSTTLVRQPRARRE